MERALIVLAAVGLLVFQNHQLLHAREQVRTLRVERENYREAAAFHRAYVERQMAQMDRWRQLEQEINQQEGHDAPLSPYLRVVLDGVREP